MLEGITTSSSCVYDARQAFQNHIVILWRYCRTTPDLRVFILTAVTCYWVNFVRSNAMLNDPVTWPGRRVAAIEKRFVVE